MRDLFPRSLRKFLWNLAFLLVLSSHHPSPSVHWSKKYVAGGNNSSRSKNWYYWRIFLLNQLCITLSALISAALFCFPSHARTHLSHPFFSFTYRFCLPLAFLSTVPPVNSLNTNSYIDVTDVHVGCKSHQDLGQDISHVWWPVYSGSEDSATV